MREEARVAHHKGEDEKKRLENQIRALKEKLEATEGDHHHFFTFNIKESNFVLIQNNL